MENKDIFSEVLTNDIRKCIENCIFPDNLKNADISPHFKKMIGYHFTYALKTIRENTTYPNLQLLQ